MRIARIVLLSMAIALSSCETQVKSDEARSRPSALVVTVRDIDRNPIPFCSVEIGQHKIGGTTDARGLARIDDVPPGTWLVSWRLTGYFEDSLRFQFDPGQQESLEVILQGPAPERANPYENRRR